MLAVLAGGALAALRPDYPYAAVLLAGLAGFLVGSLLSAGLSWLFDRQGKG